jgi:hypothetical protein
MLLRIPFSKSENSVRLLHLLCYDCGRSAWHILKMDTNVSNLITTSCGSIFSGIHIVSFDMNKAISHLSKFFSCCFGYSFNVLLVIYFLLVINKSDLSVCQEESSKLYLISLFSSTLIWHDWGIFVTSRILEIRVTNNKWTPLSMVLISSLLIFSFNLLFVPLKHFYCSKKLNWIFNFNVQFFIYQRRIILCLSTCIS